MRDAQPCSARRYLIPRSGSKQVCDCPASFWRYLYTEVGRAYRWVDRLPWTDDEIRAYLEDPAVSLWLMTVGGAPAGYFELRRDRTGASRSSTSGCCRISPGVASAGTC